VNTIEAIISNAVEAAQQLKTKSTGELCMDIVSRLEPGTAIRITSRGVRVTHAHYIDKLGSADSVNEAINRK